MVLIVRQYESPELPTRYFTVQELGVRNHLTDVTGTFDAGFQTFEHAATARHTSYSLSEGDDFVENCALPFTHNEFDAVGYGGNLSGPFLARLHFVGIFNCADAFAMGREAALQASKSNEPRQNSLSIAGQSERAIAAVILNMTGHAWQSEPTPPEDYPYLYNDLRKASPAILLNAAGGESYRNFPFKYRRVLIGDLMNMQLRLMLTKGEQQALRLSKFVTRRVLPAVEEFKKNLRVVRCNRQRAQIQEATTSWGDNSIL